MFSTPQNVRGAVQQTGEILPGQLPVRGINARDALARMAPDDAVLLINVLSDPSGLTVRNGYQEYAAGIQPLADVGTVMSYYPSTANQSGALQTVPQSALTEFRVLPRAAVVDVAGEIFACTGGDIFDITAGGSGPWVEEPNVNETSDLWSWINFQVGGTSYLLSCNQDGGYYTYSGASFSDGFSNGFNVKGTGFRPVLEGQAPGTIQGVNPELLCFIMAWKRRLWFIEVDSSRAWYLGIEAITGPAQSFDFGTHFRHGGRLEMLVSWTLDGGEGIDDYLVAISSEGDVVIYKGTDPNDAATFGLHGIWYVGALPIDRRCAESIGGELYILSINGISPMSELVAMGEVAQDLSENLGGRIDPYIRRLMATNQMAHGWYMTFLPAQQMLMVGVPPTYAGEGSIQLVYKTRQKAWSVLTDLPIATIIQHGGLIFGGGRLNVTGVTGAGSVFLMFDNLLDMVQLADPTSGVLVKSRVTPAYSSFGSPGLFKRFTMVRPTFVTQGKISAMLTVLTDYAQSSYASVPTLPASLGYEWDAGDSLWDTATWAGFGKPIHKWLGVNGSGFAATVQIDFVSAGGTKLGSIDWNTVSGGIL